MVYTTKLHHRRRKWLHIITWFIWNDFTYMWKYTMIKVVIWCTFPFASGFVENEFKSSRNSEEYLYAGTPALDLVAFLNNGSRLCCSGAGPLSSVLCYWLCVTRLHFTGGGVMTNSDWCQVSRDRGRVTVCGGGNLMQQMYFLTKVLIIFMRIFKTLILHMKHFELVDFATSHGLRTQV